MTAGGNYAALPVTFLMTSLVLVAWPGQELRTWRVRGPLTDPIPRGPPSQEWTPTTLIAHFIA